MKDNISSIKILMIGPALDGFGGISHVIKIWKQNDFFERYNIDFIPSTISCKNLGKKFLFFFKAILIFLTKIFHEYSIIYIHTSSKFSFRRKLCFILIALLFKKRIFLHIHPNHFYDYLLKINRLEKLIVTIAIEKINILIVLNKIMKNNMQKLFPKNVFFELNNPVDCKKMKPNCEIKRAECSLLYMGLYIKEKGIYNLVDAIQYIQSKGYKIELIFHGTKNIEALKNYIRSKNLNSLIKVNGWINGNNKLEALNRCTALVLPSHSEGIPNVILEAMATKTPIISTDVGGLAEVLRHRVNAIVVKPLNVIDLSNKIIDLLGNEMLRKWIAENAYIDVQKKYDIKIITNRFEELIWMDP